MLGETFTSLVKKYTDDNQLPVVFWKEIEQHYTERGRHYHTLHHLEYLLNILQGTQSDDPDTLLFSLFYHDFVYKATARDNEEQSAAIARERLASLGYPARKIARCSDQILATKTHVLSPDPDANLFTDADLSILGQEWTLYSTYGKQVRKEYSVYPDLLYKPGRKKVLNHFLSMERIFKTEPFYIRFEAQARLNL